MRRVRQVGLGVALAVFVAAPVGAGATGHSALAMLVFAGMLLLANAVMRPASVRLDAPGPLAAQVLTATAVAALLVSLGQTIRALGQLETEQELFGWAFVAAWALVLARIVWPPRMTDRIGQGAETVLREVHRSGEAARKARPPVRPPAAPPPPKDGPAPPKQASAPPSAPAPGPDPAAPRPAPARKAAPAPAPERTAETTTEPGPAPAPETAPAPVEEIVEEPVEKPAPPAPPPSPALAEALARLDRLPTLGATGDDLADALEALSGAAPPDDVFARLADRATPDGAERDRRVLVRHATDPRIAERRRGRGAPAAAFEAVVAAADEVSLGEFATLSLALLDEMPQARADYPTVARLLEIADQIETAHEEQAELLVALAHELEDLALEAGDDDADG